MEDEAALAEYIIDNDVGITVKSLADINDAISNISPERYKQLKENAEKIGQGLRVGINSVCSRTLKYSSNHCNY